MIKSQTIQDIKATDNSTIQDTATPIIVKHQISNTQIETIQSTDSTKSGDQDRINIVSNTSATIAPPSESTNQSESTNSIDPTNDNQSTQEALPQESVQAKQDSNPVTNESYAAVDALPSKAAQDTTATTNDMQQPRIYDTKEYFVPIHDTTHKHGHMLGTVIAGIISALLVLTIIYFVARGL